MKYWIDFLEKNAEVIPQKIAIVDQKNNRRLSYDELNREVDSWAALLQSLDAKKNDTIAFFDIHNSLEHLTIMLACAKLSVLFVPLNFRLSNIEIEKVLNLLSPKIFLGRGENKFNVGFSYLNIENVHLDSYKNYIKNKATLDDVILMLFTSGSTGLPKGVMFHGQMLWANQKETCDGWNLRANDITLVETPFFHTGGYNVLLLPLLYLGGTVILATSFVPENVFKTIENEKISVYFAVPTMFQLLLENAYFFKCNFKSIRFFISGGAACPPPMIEEYQKKGLVFKQGFGLTEVGPNCFILDEKDAIRKSGSIGKPMPHSLVRIVDKNNNEVNVDEAGELLIKGPHVCAGYYKNEKVFKENLRDGFFSTGDLVKFDSEGYFYVVGRIKDMYISGGENIYPGEVEAEIKKHCEVKEAVVVSVPDQKWGEVGFLFIKAKREFSIEEVRHYLNASLSRYKHPHYVISLEEFPLLPNGKVDRNLLKIKGAKISQTVRS